MRVIKVKLQGKQRVSVGNERVSIEPWERARWTVRSVRVTDECRGDDRINGVNGMSDPAAAGLRGKQRVSVGNERVSTHYGQMIEYLPMNGMERVGRAT